VRALAILTLLAALPASSGCGDFAPGCLHRSDDFFRLDPFGSELPAPPEGILTGRFTRWQVGESIFETTSGERFGFGLILEGEAVVPDLARLGTVDLHARGFQGTSREPTNPNLEVFAPGDRDRLIAALGNRELLAPTSRLAIAAPRDNDSCMQYGHENGRARNKPVTVTVDDDSAVLYQGEAATLGAFDVRVVTAQSNNRSHPWAPCSDALCPWEKLAWIATSEEIPDLVPEDPAVGDDDDSAGDDEDDSGGAEPR